MPQDDAAQLQSLIQAANAGWTAGTTSVSELPPERQARLLGYRGGGPDPEEANSSIAVPSAEPPGAAGFRAKSFASSSAPTQEPPKD